jgi:hypothetical protein
VVALVQVDRVDLQPAKALVAGLDDVTPRQAAVVGPLTHLAVDLGRDDQRIAARRPAIVQPSAEHLLADRFLIDVGCIKEIDALCNGVLHDRAACIFIRTSAEVHVPQTDR